MRIDPGVWPMRLEPGQTPALGLQLVDREELVVAPGRMHHVVGAAAHRAAAPAVDQIEAQRRMHADGRVQAGRRLPGAEAHAGDVRCPRSPVGCNGMARPLQVTAKRSPSRFMALTCSRSSELSTIADGAADGPFLAHDVPGLECLRAAPA